MMDLSRTSGKGHSIFFDANVEDGVDEQSFNFVCAFHSNVTPGKASIKFMAWSLERVEVPREAIYKTPSHVLPAKEQLAHPTPSLNNPRSTAM